MTRFLLLASTCLALAACGDTSETPSETDENLDARGEVLGGSISDDMLPLDTVTSQSPSQGADEEAASSNGGSAPAAPAPAPAEPAEEPVMEPPQPQLDDQSPET